jgi:hypothetical protein
MHLRTHATVGNLQRAANTITRHVRLAQATNSGWRGRFCTAADKPALVFHRGVQVWHHPRAKTSDCTRKLHGTDRPFVTTSHYVVWLSKSECHNSRHRNSRNAAAKRSIDCTRVSNDVGSQKHFIRRTIRVIAAYCALLSLISSS